MRKISVLIIVALFVAGIFSIPARAKEAQFKLDIDNSKLHQGETTGLVLTVKNGKRAEKIGINGLENFRVLSQGSTTQTRIVNFDKNFIKKYYYQITAKDSGQFSLQGVVKYQGQKYQTNSLSVEVSKDKKSPRRSKEPLFIETSLAQDEIYFGQQVVLSYNLFSRYNIQDYGFKEKLSFNNFISKKIKQDQLDANYVRLDGKKYVKYEVAKVILTPTTTGDLKIPEFPFQVNVSTGDFFNSTQAKYLTTQNKEIKVQSLPQNGQPDNFSGLVGELKLDAKFSKDKIEYGDSATLKVTALGTCNLDNLNELVKEKIKGFEIYETGKSSTGEIKGTRYQSQKNFEIILVPKQSGRLKFPKLKVPYFNPQTESYQYATIAEKTFEIIGSPKDKSTTKQLEPQTVKIKQVNLQQNKSKDYYTLKIKKIYLKWGLILGSVLVVGLLILLAVNKYRSSDDQLSKIYKKIQKTDSETKLYQELNRLLKIRYGLSLKADSRQKIKNKISEQQLVEDIFAVMDYIENKKYGVGDRKLDLKEKIKSIYSNRCFKKDN